MRLATYILSIICILSCSQNVKNEKKLVAKEMTKFDVFWNNFEDISYFNVDSSQQYLDNPIDLEDAIYFNLDTLQKEEAERMYHFSYGYRFQVHNIKCIVYFVNYVGVQGLPLPLLATFKEGKLISRQTLDNQKIIGIYLENDRVAIKGLFLSSDEDLSVEKTNLYKIAKNGEILF